MKPMILLGINCGFGNADCATLPIRALDLEEGWINFPRPKTGLDRRCPLWPETIKSLQEWLAQTIESGNADDFLHYRERAPEAVRNHPSEEHFLPIYVAAGAGTSGTNGRRIHRSYSFGTFAMDAYRFD